MWYKYQQSELPCSSVSTIMLRNSYKTFFDYNIRILRYCSLYLKDEPVTSKQKLVRKLHSFVCVTYVMVIFLFSEFKTLSLNMDNPANFIQILRDIINHSGAVYKTYVWYKHQDSICRVLKVLTHNYNYEAYGEFQPGLILAHNRNYTLRMYKLLLWMVNLLCVFLALLDIYVIMNPNQGNHIKKFPNFGESLSGKIIGFFYRMIPMDAYGWVIMCK